MGDLLSSLFIESSFHLLIPIDGQQVVVVVLFLPSFVVVLVCLLFFSEHFNDSSFVDKMLVIRHIIGDSVVFGPHILSEMKITFGHVEMELEFGDERK